MLFEYESGKIRAKIEINKYKDSNEIKKDIKILLNNYNIEFNKNFFMAEYEYLQFIKKCLKEKDANSKDFIILYFNLLNKEKLESFIKNSENNDIKNYNLSKILNTDNNINITNDNIQNNNNSINQVIINSNIINSSNNENISKINKINTNINNAINDNNNIKHPNDNTSINENKNLSNDSIESEFDINEQNEDLVNNIEMIEALKNDLSHFSIRDYFIEQINKYSNKFSKNSTFRKYITKYNYKIKNDVYNNIDKKTFPIIHLIYSLLLNQINDSTKKYDKTFGFIVIDKKEFLYTFHNDELIESFLYESEKRDQYEYDNSINSTCYKELKSLDNFNKSNKSVKIFKKNNSIFKSNESYISVESYKTHSNNNNKNNQIEYDELTFFNDYEFENNSTYIFKNLFDLKDLPNYFFAINKKSNYNRKYTTFFELSENLFSSFIETDGAYINNKDIKLSPKLKSNYPPFLIHNTFVVKKIGEEYKLESIEEGLEIDKKTIIIVDESKLSNPKNIKDFSFTEEYNIDDLTNTLILLYIN